MPHFLQSKSLYLSSSLPPLSLLLYHPISSLMLSPHLPGTVIVLHLHSCHHSIHRKQPFAHTYTPLTLKLPSSYTIHFEVQSCVLSKHLIICFFSVEGLLLSVCTALQILSSGIPANRFLQIKCSFLSVVFGPSFSVFPQFLYPFSLFCFS